jgi:hypothetical protein
MFVTCGNCWGFSRSGQFAMDMLSTKKQLDEAATQTKTCFYLGKPVRFQRRG